MAPRITLTLSEIAESEFIAQMVSPCLQLRAIAALLLWYDTIGSYVLHRPSFTGKGYFSGIFAVHSLAEQFRLT